MWTAPTRSRYPRRLVPRVDQRSALDTLTKARLIELADGFELSIAHGRPKDEFIDGLAASRRASFEKLLGLLSRDELKAICRAHELSDRGVDASVEVRP